jgi:release factor glutamine methyltransferase
MSSKNPTASQLPTVWTIKELLTWTTKYLQDKGFESARLEAQVLLAHVLGCNKIDLMVRYDEQPTDLQRAKFRELVKRRVEHWPVAYLIGRRDFYLLSFEVTPAVLIPRPETETLVLSALDRLKGKLTANVLDLGTGSGCIAVSIAHQFKGATVTAVDVSPDAIEVAKRNATTHGVSDRVRFLLGDLFDPIPSGSSFDLIVSNPPYVTPSELANLAPEVRDHEPRLALDGGPDGLNFYRRIASGAEAYLIPGGTVLVEIGSTQEAAVRSIFTAAGFTVGNSIKDATGRLRVVTATKT